MQDLYVWVITTVRLVFSGKVQSMRFFIAVRKVRNRKQKNPVNVLVA